jgi:hypothetical protein
MGKLEEEYPAKHPEPHSTPETAGTRCNMCEHLSCIEQPGAKVHRWAYYCRLLYRRMTFKDLYAITKEECPEHRDLRRRKFKL